MVFDKIICLTDIHFGLKGNSKVHNEDCLEFVKYMIEVAKERGIKVAAFLGDWHHNRHTINIETLKYSTEAMKLMNEYFDTVYFIEGNHDLYYRDNRLLSSVRHSTLLDKFVLINTPTTIGDVTFLPWLVGDEWKQVKKIKSKYVFGHFELPTFLLNQMVEMPETNQLNKDDFSNAAYVFSGHFHKRQNKDNVWYIGNCFPHDFADVNDDDRGLMILEWDKAPEFVRWENAPRYRKYAFSDLQKNLSLLDEPKIHAKIEYMSSEVTPSQIAIFRENIKENYDIRSVKFIDVAKTVIQDEESDNDEDEDDMATIDVESTVIKHLNRIDSKQYDVSLLVRLYKEL